MPSTVRACFVVVVVVVEHAGEFQFDVRRLLLWVGLATYSAMTDYSY